MANGEWLTQLMAGLGGAFTGATQAKSRMAEEAEAERKRMELENERARLKRIQELRGGGFSEASARELLSLGETPGNVESLKDLFTPKAKPTYEERREGGGVAVYEDGRFRSWKIRPPSERDAAPSDRLTGAQARTERGRLQGDVESAQAGFSSLMRQRPKRAEFVGEAPGAYESALKGFQAESTMAAGRRTGAQQRLSAFEQEYGLTPPPAASAMVPNAGMQQQVAAEMQRTIQGIMADPTLDDMQKRQLIQRVNERASSLLRNR